VVLREALDRAGEEYPIPPGGQDMLSDREGKEADMAGSPDFWLGFTSALSLLFVLLAAYIMLNANKPKPPSAPKGAR